MEIAPSRAKKHIKSIIKGVYFWASNGIENPHPKRDAGGRIVGQRYLVEPQGTYKRNDTIWQNIRN